jgi:hypothetical protein
MNAVHHIIEIVLFVISIYLFCVNRKLSRLKIDEELEKLGIEEQEVEQKFRDKLAKYKQDLSKRGWTPMTSGSFEEHRTKSEKEKKIELQKIEIRRKYLNKLKKFKWLWSKID